MCSAKNISLVLCYVVSFCLTGNNVTKKPIRIGKQSKRTMPLIIDKLRNLEYEQESHLSLPLTTIPTLEHKASASSIE